MKRRSTPKLSTDNSRRLGSSTRSNIPVKKTTKKRLSRDATSSVLGLKKTESPCGSGESKAVDHIAECQRLREQLESVLVDHQRQEEEIVALRALAKSLTQEVEVIHERQLRQSTCISDRVVHREDQHENSFKLNVQVEELQGQNEELRRQLEYSQKELKSARDRIAEKLPVYKLAAIKANAELRCVKSQLQQERDHSDLLQKQLVRCKARQDDVPVRVSLERGNNQNEHDEDSQESEAARRERKAFLRQCSIMQDTPERKQLNRNGELKKLH
ncbi:hypothetical protein GN244_ATG18979 [Phytophthora infestans]|uniref:Uncharacterized protein n=1 Tax=Phytophthora infestans TaxID=4787 RepID=A0A833SH57_PHYIN|nr:hypothetical protein GN244_ATG18979 [Phytophthora infestans]